ncbi:MerR family DNA-binding protein [Paraburkholderia sediminicola]|uniref:MerR family DNA-binding protein n=1 Tax=Paraburkholderia sediminicola TaxID=458836 RepID=UPI0038B8F57D
MNALLAQKEWKKLRRDLFRAFFGKKMAPAKLLTSVRASNSYRAFPNAAVAQVRQIQRMIATGFSLADIRSFPDCMRMIEGASSCAETTDAQRKRLASIERQIAELERLRARLLKTLAEGIAPPLD